MDATLAAKNADKIASLQSELNTIDAELKTLPCGSPEWTQLWNRTQPLARKISSLKYPQFAQPPADNG